MFDACRPGPSSGRRREFRAGAGTRCVVIDDERLERNRELEDLDVASGSRSWIVPVHRSVVITVVVAELCIRPVAPDAHVELRVDDGPRLARAAGLSAGARHGCRGGTSSRAESHSRRESILRATGTCAFRILQDQMPARNSPVRYGYVAQALHWIIVGLLIVQVTLGRSPMILPLGLEKLITLARHKSFGITILGSPSSAWPGARSTAPAEPPMPRWQLAAAAPQPLGAVRNPLRSCPVRWLMSSASNIPVSWFGLVQLPDFVEPDRGLKERSTRACVAVVCAVRARGLHVGGAQAQFVD
jgi:cytochrome b561